MTEAKSLKLVNIDPLDLIFFRGSDLTSDMIAMLEKHTTTCGDWTHVGIVINSDILPDVGLKDHTLYVWESTFSTKLWNIEGKGCVSELTKKGFFGTQVRNLETLIPSYIKKGGKVGYGKLLHNPWTEANTKEEKEKIKKDFKVVFDKLNHTKYDFNPLSLLGSMFTPIRILNEYIDHDEDKALFCSEHVAKVFMEMNLLPKTINQEHALPVDFLGHDVDFEIQKMVYDVIPLF